MKKINKLYKKGEVKEREQAEKAAVTFEYLKNFLEHNGFSVGEISQSREFPDPMLSTANYPLGLMDIHTKELTDADQIKELKELEQFGLQIIGGHEKIPSKGGTYWGLEDLSGASHIGKHNRILSWGNLAAFMKGYEKHCENHQRGKRKPDYLVLSGRDPISNGAIVLRVGQVPVSEKKGLMARVLGK